MRARKRQSDALAQRRKFETVVSTGNFYRPGRILIADGNSKFLRETERLLEGRGHHTISTDLGEQVLRLARHDPPDLILVNAALPNINGPEICRKLKLDPELQFTPILILTGCEDRETHVKCFENGANDFLHMPVDGDVLLARVRNLLKYRFAVSALRDAQDHHRVQRRFEITRSLLEGRPAGWEDLETRGQGDLARMLSLVQFLDYLSVYLAGEASVDPMTVDSIDQLKQRLADAD